jgi:hypothetical protein
MKRIVKYIVYSALASGFMYSCAGFEQVKLNTNSDKPYYKPSTDEGVVMRDTILFDFRAPINEWWADPHYVISKVGSVMRVKSMGAGPTYNPFGVSFDPHNFSKAPFLKVKMKLEEGITDYPQLRLDLKDINGRQTNGSPASVIVDSAGYKIYIFDFFKKFKQTYPDNQDVDATKITGLQIFVNPGGKKWDGTLYIDDILTTQNPDGSKKLPDDFVLEDFSGGIDLWWGCDKVSVFKNNATSLKVHYDNVNYACFGKVFGEVDVTETPVIRLKAKAISTNGVTKTNIMARFVDVNENASDLVDASNMMDVKVGSEFAYFYSNFTNNLKSSSGKFDSKRINKVIIFVNMNQPQAFTGDFIFDDVTFLKQMPK